MDEIIINDIGNDWQTYQCVNEMFHFTWPGVVAVAGVVAFRDRTFPLSQVATVGH